jgi:hypothetical protein
MECKKVRSQIESSKLSRVEMGYMLQTVRHSSETQEGRQRINHVIRITFVSDTSL